MPTNEENVMETSVISQALNKVDRLYATMLGQPFEGQGIDMTSDRWVLNITVIIHACCNFCHSRKSVNEHLVRTFKEADAA